MTELYLLVLPNSAICQDVNKAGENAKLTDFRRIHGLVIKDSVLNSISKHSYNIPYSSMFLS